MRLVVLLLLLPTLATAERVELLHNVYSQVAVSSSVESKTILPAHLADGKLDTAWNSARDRLVGEWIEFIVPAEVTVDEIKLVVGHTGKGKEGDYFPMNHRIKKVGVTRDGKPLGDFTLDPNKRELQSIPIAQPGGTYRITIRETVRGTQRKWREIAVAELEVWGTLPKGMTPRYHAVFDVTVGTHHPPYIGFVTETSPTKTLEERCKVNLCKVEDLSFGKLVPKTGPIRTVLTQKVGNYTRVFVETAAGWWYATSAEWPQTRAPATKVEELAVKDGILHYRVLHQGERGQLWRLFTLCGLDASGAPVCLRRSIPIEVREAGGALEREYVVTLANGYLGIDYGPNKRGSPFIIGDYKLPF